MLFHSNRSILLKLIYLAILFYTYLKIVTASDVYQKYMFSQIKRKGFVILKHVSVLALFFITFVRRDICRHLFFGNRNYL